MPTPEEQARETIDTLLTQAGRFIQDSNQVNLSAVRGGDIRNILPKFSKGLKKRHSPVMNLEWTKKGK